MSKIDYKAVYEALIEDIRKHGVIEMCEICVGTYPPRVSCEFDCDTCAEVCRCKDCLHDSNWKWRGEAVFGLTEDDSPHENK